MRSTTVLPRTTRRPVRRTLSATAALCLALSLAACSGDDDESDSPSEDGSSSATGGFDEAAEEAPGAPERRCTATVELTGAVESSWSGKALARLRADTDTGSGPDAVYTTTNKREQLSVYSAGEEFENAVTYTRGNQTFSADPALLADAAIETNGKSATVDVALNNVQGDEANVVAEITCGNGGGKKKNNNDG
ncbi:hypothetical protein [Nocardioides nanhaiensis]|uniref:Lipoprotein n=1 Tax=Nocardioides nanhaiensis TaxID=1476871 RepID=A0ABP8X327_9ACTN